MDTKQAQGKIVAFYHGTILPNLKKLSTFLKEHQPVLDSKIVTLITALYILAFTNFTFWKKGYGYFEGHEYQLFLLGIALFALHMTIMLLFSAKYVLKPFYSFLLITAAAAAHFTDTYGTLINTDMIRNAATTTGNEAKHLFTLTYFRNMLLFGFVPVALLLWTKVTYLPFKQKFKKDSLIAISGLVVTFVLVLLHYASYSSTFREKKDFMGSLNPSAPIVSTFKYVKGLFKNRNIVVQPIGLDAKKGTLSANLQKPRLTIVIAGETARTQNFSLNGYKVETNPKLKARNVISFKNVTSCGTATAVSLPCMFSKYTRSSYSHYNGLSTENVADVMKHAGITVEWWDNNTGDKGIGKRIHSINISRENDPKHCYGGECRDSIFLKHLKAYIPTIKQDTVIIMHQIGSHGPTYYLRYPEEFEKFKPACRTAEFARCTYEQIVRSYDNTILYTDHIVASIIDMLKKNSDKVSTSMLYMSDHGESLGENGLYLHGFPYMLAPETQTRVPFIAWFSDEFSKDNKLDISCIRASEKDEASHDNLFHSILGVMDIQTSEYNKDLDIFAKCRSK